MINQKTFVEQYYPSANDSRKNDVIRFLNNLAELLGEQKPKSALCDKQLLCKAFYLQQAGNSISRPHYQKVKEYLHNVFDFLNINGSIPTREEVIESQNLLGYFRGINELLKFIDNIGEEKINSYNPTTDLIRLKSVCVLGWIGFTTMEISNLKKRDLIPIGIDGYKIKIGEKAYEIYGEPFAALFYLSSLEEYNSLPSKGSRGRKIVLKSSDEYLFRSQDPDCEKLDEKQIVQILERFNRSLTGNIKIIFRNLHRNALFLELYNDKTDKNLLTKIMDIFECSYHMALSYRAQYLKFEKALNSNEI